MAWVAVELIEDELEPFEIEETYINTDQIIHMRPFEIEDGKHIFIIQFALGQKVFITQESAGAIMQNTMQELMH